MKITINVSHIRAALVAMPRNDIRYYLNGALIETGSGADESRIVVVATDGHRLTASDAGPGPREIGQFIIPRTVCENIARFRLPRDAHLYGRDQVELAFDGLRVTATMFDKTSFGGQLIEGKYPQWRKIVRTTAGQGMGAVLKPRYMAEALRFFDALSKRREHFILIDTDTSDASVLLTESGVPGVMIVMPLKIAAEPSLEFVQSLIARPVAEEIAA